MERKLEIGVRGRRSGWVTLDMVGPADIVAPAVPLPDAVRHQRWDVVQMIHVLEHFTFNEARQLLAELLPITEHLVIEVPNIAYAAHRILTDEQRDRIPSDRMAMWPLYGDQRHGEAYAHKWGYTPTSLRALLGTTGWSSIVQETPKFHVPERDLRMICRGQYTASDQTHRKVCSESDNLHEVEPSDVANGKPAQ